MYAYVLSPHDAGPRSPERFSSTPSTFQPFYEVRKRGNSLHHVSRTAPSAATALVRQPLQLSFMFTSRFQSSTPCLRGGILGAPGSRLSWLVYSSDNDFFIEKETHETLCSYSCNFSYLYGPKGVRMFRNRGSSLQTFAGLRKGLGEYPFIRKLPRFVRTKRPTATHEHGMSK